MNPIELNQIITSWTRVESSWRSSTRSVSLSRALLCCCISLESIIISAASSPPSIFSVPFFGLPATALLLLPPCDWPWYCENQITVMRWSSRVWTLGIFVWFWTFGCRLVPEQIGLWLPVVWVRYLDKSQFKLVVETSWAFSSSSRSVH